MLSIKDGYYVWTKGDSIGLTPHFSTTEFECNCQFIDCVVQKISVSLLDGLEKMRVELNAPMNIASGYRCAAYQMVLTKTLGDQTVVNSQHVLGNAADPYSSGRTKEVQRLAQKYFKAVGLGPTKTHVDTRDDRVRRWSYK
jgi:uncharacterized protein YcbK (DUF882 family)